MTKKIFQILRNSSVYNDYKTAAAAFNVPADVTGLIDGQLKSARYVDGDAEKAIIGIWDSATNKWSMIDIESSLLHAVLNAKQINVTDPSSNETKALDEVIFENETVTAASLNDLNEKIKAIENANFGDSINNAISTAAADASTKANAAKEAAIATAAEDASTKANAAKEAAISASDVTLVHDDGTLIYTLYQGTNNNKSEIGKINIPKDMVVESGSVITATDDDVNNDSTVVVGEKYIKLVVTNVEKPLYIAVNDLYKDHTAAKNATEVQVAISDNNEISATIVNVDASKVTLNDPKGTKLQDALTTINNILINKQNIIDDLSTIRNKATTAYQKPASGIPSTDLAEGVIPSFTIVNDHSGAGDDPNKIYIPSAESEKETHDGLSMISNGLSRVEAAGKTNSSAITAIEGKIPVAATTENQLADKNFVNSSIATATATFRGTFNVVTDLGGTEQSSKPQIEDLLGNNSVSAEADDNDYCFVLIPTSSSTPTEIARIERYKATKGTAMLASWHFEYTLNNSGFTADQWAAINSHITSGLVTKLDNLPDNAALTTLLNGKQDVISDLGVIRSGAAAGATALQPSALDDFYNKSQVESLLAFEVAEGSMSAKLRGTHNVVSGEASLSLGQDNNVSGVNAFALGEYNRAYGRDSFVHGKMNRADADKSHAEGNGTRCEGSVSHAEGSVTISNGSVSHSEGYGTVAHDMSHTEGVGAIVFRIKTLNNPNHIYKVISGVDTLSNVFKGFFIVTVVSNDDYHICTTSYATITNIEVREEDEEEVTAEDAGIYITTNDKLVVDPSNDTKAYILVNAGFTPGSHIEGYYNLSGSFNGFKSFINSYIHSCFDKVLINKIYGGHVEGIGNIIGGKYSHAEGALNSTNNAIVHIEGKGNIANADYQHVEGKFNEPDSTAAHIIGNGTDNEHRSNALSVDWEGNLKIKGNLKDSQGNIIDTTKLVVVDDHSGAGDDPNKIYIPSAESEKETHDGLSMISNGLSRVEAAGKTNSSAITAIEGKIPDAATSENQLADKNFVNSSIATATATAYQKPAGGIPSTDLADGVIPSFAIVNDHSGAGDDPNKIYIPSAESEKETHDSVMVIPSTENNASAKLKGTTNIVRAAKAVAFGDYNTIGSSATESIVAGRMNLVGAAKGAAFGNCNHVGAPNGFASGGFNNVSRNNSYAEGVGNYVNGQVAHMEGNSILQITLTGAANATTYTITETLPSFFIGLPVFYAVSPENNNGVAIFTQAVINAIDAENNTITLSTTLSASVALENVTARVLCSTTQLKSSHVEGSHNFIILNDALTENPLQDTIIKDLFNTENKDRLQGGHVEGFGNVIAGKYSHAEGVFNLVTKQYSHAEGNNNKVLHQQAHAEGCCNIVDSNSAHVEGSNNYAHGAQSHAEGYSTKTLTVCAHAEGKRTVAVGKASHVQGENNITQGDYSHSEGYGNKAVGKASHAGGDGSLIVNLTGAAKVTTYSVDVTPTTEWVGCLIKTTIDNGINVYFSITEIDATNNTITVNETLDGTNALSNAPYSIALGGAIADYSFAHGKGVQAATEAGAVFGKFNVPRNNALFAIGNGTSYTNQHDAFYVDIDGNVYIAGNIVNAQMTQLTDKITDLENRIAALEGKS